MCCESPAKTPTTYDVTRYTFACFGHYRRERVAPGENLFDIEIVSDFDPRLEAQVGEIVVEVLVLCRIILVRKETKETKLERTGTK